MNILFVGAMHTEINALKETYNLVEIKKLANKFPLYQNDNIFLLECFVGENNASVATTLALAELNIDLVIKVGCVGGTTEGLNKNDIIIPKGYFHTGSWITRDYEDNKPTAIASKWQSVFGDKPYQVNQNNLGNIPYVFFQDQNLIDKYSKVLNDLKLKGKEAFIGGGNMWFFDQKFMDHIKDNILPRESNLKSWCADMESYAIAHSCYIFGKPFIGIYFVASSDYSDIDGYDPDNIENQTKNTIMPIIEKFLKEVN